MNCNDRSDHYGFSNRIGSVENPKVLITTKNSVLSGLMILLCELVMTILRVSLRTAGTDALTG